MNPVIPYKHRLSPLFTSGTLPDALRWPMCPLWHAPCITKVTCDSSRSKNFPGPKGAPQ